MPKRKTSSVRSNATFDISTIDGRAKDISNDFAVGDDIYDRFGDRYNIEKRNAGSKFALLRGPKGFYGWINIESAMLLDGEPVAHWLKFRPTQLP